MTATLFHNGVIYAPGQPEATAILVDGGSIAWIGDDATGFQVAPGAQRYDLAGALVTALPVDLRPNVQTKPLVGTMASTRKDLKLSAAEVIADPQKLQTAIAELGPNWNEAVAIHCSGDATEVSQLLADLFASGVRLGRVRLVLEADAQFSEDLIGVLPVMVAVLVDVTNGAHGVPLARLVGEGYVLALFSDLNPWSGMQLAANHPDHPLTGRAAYQAYTRSAWRIVGEQNAGTVQIGMAAHLGLWLGEELTVHVPQVSSKVGAWSTDLRARSGLLPDLSSGAPVPALVLAIVAGEQVPS